MVQVVVGDVTVATLGPVHCSRHCLTVGEVRSEKFIALALGTGTLHLVGGVCNI